MEFGNSIAGLNWLAVVTAAVAAFLLGAAWYSRKLFGTIWMKEIGLTEEAFNQGKTARIVGGTFLLQLVGAAALAVLLGPGSGWLPGLQYGLLVGLGWIATAYGVTYFFEQRSLRLYLINAGFYVLLFAAMGTIIGALS